MACGSGEINHGKHKDVVNEMCNMAHAVVKKHHCHDHGATTEGCIKNITRSDCVKFLSKHDWSGHTKQDYPSSITKSKPGTFFHVAHCRGHSDEAAVVYYDECGSAWLVAWSVKDESDGYNKVYVETGPIEDYKNIKWNEIKARLEVSTDTGYYNDNPRRNEAFATITTNGNKAELAATFKAY